MGFVLATFYVKAGGALRSNRAAPNGGVLVTVGSKIAVQNAICSREFKTLSVLDQTSVTTGINGNERSLNLLWRKLIIGIRTSNTSFTVAGSSTVNTGSWTNHASPT